MSGGCGCGGSGMSCTTTQKVAAFSLLSLLALSANHKKIAMGIVATSVALYSYLKYDVLYNLIAGNRESINYPVEIESSPRMEGDEHDNILVAHPEGSQIFPGLGINVVYAGVGQDNIYFSMCKTQVIDGKSTIIKNFDPTQDKVTLFCSQRMIELDDISYDYDPENDETYVKVTNNVNPKDGSPYKDLFFIIEGDHDAGLDIVLNQKWDVSGEHKCHHHHDHGE